MILNIKISIDFRADEIKKKGDRQAKKAFTKGKKMTQ
jgi:hypothetical protein